MVTCLTQTPWTTWTDGTGFKVLHHDTWLAIFLDRCRFLLAVVDCLPRLAPYFHGTRTEHPPIAEFYEIPIHYVFDSTMCSIYGGYSQF